MYHNVFNGTGIKRDDFEEGRLRARKVSAGERALLADALISGNSRLKLLVNRQSVVIVLYSRSRDSIERDFQGGNKKYQIE